MEIKRDYLEIENEFVEAFGIVSSLSDLLTGQDESSFVLSGDTLPQTGYACFNQSGKMRVLFIELMELYLAERNRNK